MKLLTRLTIAVLSTACIACLVSRAEAQEGPFEIQWSSIDSGGGTSSGGEFSVSGTIGQPDVGQLSAGDTILTGGFWAALLPPPCPADLDASGDVGFADVLMLITAWGPCAPCAEDLDGDGTVAFADLLALLSAWGACG